jgi:hypothetical protein
MDYYSARSDLQKKVSESRRYQLIAVSAIALLGIMSLLAILLSIRACMRNRIEEMSSVYEESQRMLKSLESNEADANKLKERFASIYKKQYSYLNDLCEAYLAPAGRDRRESIYDKAADVMKMFSDDMEAQRQLESEMNEALDGIVHKLRVDLAGHSESDFRFLQYCIIGLEAKTISRIMGYAVASVYTKKNRLKKEIRALDSEYKDFYLLFLD